MRKKSKFESSADMVAQLLFYLTGFVFIFQDYYLVGTLWIFGGSFYYLFYRIQEVEE